MKVGLIQTRTPATHAAALAHVLPLVKDAAAQGARLVLTPEGTNILQKNREQLLPQLTSLADDPVVNGLRDAARELSVWIDVGSVLVRREDGKAANRQVLVRPDGTVAATYDKLHMFDATLPDGRTIREGSLYEAGSRAVVVESDWGRLGLTICYDLRFPQLFRALAQAGAKLIFVPAAFTRPTGKMHWHALLRARAIENGCYIVAPATCGTSPDSHATFGHSMVVDPFGAIVMEAGDDPGVFLAEIDLDKVDLARSRIPSLTHDRKFTVDVVDARGGALA